jgi:hydrogenase maturation protease
MTSGTLVAGIGNIFLGDDGFGVEVASRLAQVGVPAGVRVADYGIRGMHLAYDLASGYDAAILIDAAPRGEAPGTLYVIEPELGRLPGTPATPPSPATAPAESDTAESDTAGATDAGGTGDGGTGDGMADDGMAGALAVSPFFDAHGMQPDVVFGMLDTLDGGRPRRILVVGCEPAALDYCMGLSDPVAAAVDGAVRLVLSLLATELATSIPATTTSPPGTASTRSAGGPASSATEGRTHVSWHSR